MNGEAFRSVELVEPFWEVRLDDTWFEVDMVVELETPAGATIYQLYYGGARSPTEHAEGDPVMSRPPKDT